LYLQPKNKRIKEVIPFIGRKINEDEKDGHFRLETKQKPKNIFALKYHNCACSNWQNKRNAVCTFCKIIMPV